MTAQSARLPQASPRGDALVKVVLVALGLVAAVAAGVLVGRGMGPLALAAVLAPVGLLIILARPEAALALWLVTVPFIFGAPTTLNLAAIWMIHRLLIPAILGVLILEHLAGIRRSGFRLHRYDLALMGFIALGIANILLYAPNVQRTLVAFHDSLVVPMLLFWLVRVIGPDVVRARMLTLIAVLVLVPQAAVGILSWVAPGSVPGEWLGREGERTTGTLGGPGPFTITLVLFAFVLVAHVAERRARLGPIVAAAGLALAGIGVALSLSRGSWLGAAAALGVVALLVPRSLRVILPIGAVALLLFAVGPLSADLAVAEQRIDTTRTVDERLATNDAAIGMIADRTLLGFGYGNFERFDEGFKSTVAGVALRRQISAHQSYLALAAENGLPALLLFFAPALGLLAATIARWRMLPGGHVDRLWLALLWAALLDQFVVANFTDILHSSPWATSLWWLTLGVVALIVDRPLDERSDVRTAVLPPGVRVAWHPAP